MEKLTPSKAKNNIFGVSIEAPKESPSVIETLRGYEAIILQEYGGFVATIIHDKDHNENGEPRRPHLHAFFELDQDKTFKQMLKCLKTALKCEEEAISLETSSNDFLLCQYLIHKGKPQKYQYSLEEVSTNDPSILAEKMAKEYKKPISMEDKIITTQTFTDFMLLVGAQEANKYRGTWNQVKTEQKADIDSLLHRLNEKDVIISSLKGQLTKLIDLYIAKAITKEDLEQAKAYLDYLEY